MDARCYVDIDMLPDSETPAPVLAGRVLEVLHRSGHRFALALPGIRPGRSVPPSRLRVFADGRDELDALIADVIDKPVVRDYAKVGYPRAVPDDFAGPWVEYRRYRVPSRKSRLTASRDRRMTAGRSYIVIRSLSSGQRFSLCVDPLPGTPGGGEPDSWGLSVSSRPFSVPLL